MKTCEDEWYIVTKAYKCTVFKILRDICITIYCVPRYAYI